MQSNALRARQGPDVMKDEPRANVVGFRVDQSPALARLLVDPQETTPREEVTPRHLEPGDWLRFERSMAEIFTAFGMNLDTLSAERTPERFLQALYDATAGYDDDYKLLTAFPTERRCNAGDFFGQIIEGPFSV